MSGSRMKRLAFFTEGTHNETWQCNSYYDVLSRFLFEVCQMSSLFAASLLNSFWVKWLTSQEIVVVLIYLSIIKSSPMYCILTIQ